MLRLCSWKIRRCAGPKKPWQDIQAKIIGYIGQAAGIGRACGKMRLPGCVVFSAHRMDMGKGVKRGREAKTGCQGEPGLYTPML